MHYIATLPWARLHTRDEFPDYGVIQAVVNVYLPVVFAGDTAGRGMRFFTPTPDNQEWIRIFYIEEEAWEFIEQHVKEWRL